MKLEIVESGEGHEELFQEMRETLINFIIERFSGIISLDVTLSELPSIINQILLEDYLLLLKNDRKFYPNLGEPLVKVKEKISNIIYLGALPERSELPEHHHLFYKFRSFISSDLDFIRDSLISRQ